MNHTKILRGLVSALTVITLLGNSPTILAASSPMAGAGSFESRYGLTLSEPEPLENRVLAMMKTNIVGSMEARIYFVENWEIAREQKAQVFFGMLAQADAEDQRKLAHAAAAYVANSNHVLVAKHLLDIQLPKTVLSVFMTDTLKRDYSIKLPTLLALAQCEGHPMQKEARELLRGYLGRDHGTNWVRWKETMMARLKSTAQ